MIGSDRRLGDGIDAPLQLTSGSAIVTGGLYVSILFQFIQVLVISHLLGDVGIGLVSLATRTVSLVQTLIVIGIPTMITRNLAASEDRACRDSLFSTSVAMTLPMSVLAVLSILVAAPYVSLAMDDLRVGPLVALLGLSLPFSSLGALALAYLRGTMQFGRYSLLLVVSPALSLFVITLLIGSLTPEVVVLSVLIATAVSSVVGLRLANPRTWKLLGGLFVRSILLPGVPLLFLALAGTFMDSIDAIVLQIITADVGIVGVYSNAYSLAAYLRYLVEPLALVLLPIASKALSSEDRVAVSSILSSSLKVIFVFFTPLAFLFAMLSPEIIGLLLPSVFLQGSLSLAVLALASPCLACYYVFSRTLIAAGKMYLLSLLVGTSLLAGFIIKVVLTLFFGMLGTAVSSAISFAIMAIVTGVFMKRTCGLALILTRRAFVGPFSVLLVSFTLRQVVSAILASYGLVHPLAVVAIVFVGVFAIETVVKPLSAEEASLIVDSVSVLPIAGRLSPMLRRILALVSRTSVH